jgi:hypothetical protein
MPARTPLPQSGEQPKTLAQAKEMLAKLRALLPGTSAELKMSADPVAAIPGTRGAPIPKATPPPRPNPDPSRPGSPGALAHAPGLDLGAMTPKALKACLEGCTDGQLKALLARETGRDRKTQNSSVIQALYRELKSR